MEEVVKRIIANKLILLVLYGCTYTLILMLHLLILLLLDPRCLLLPRQEFISSLALIPIIIFKQLKQLIHIINIEHGL